MRLRWGTLGVAALALAAGAHGAETYPVRPIRLIIPASPGSGSDFFGRTVGQGLSEIYRQQVVADNRAGAGGLIGAELIAGATPDGYTIGVAASSLVVWPLMQAKPRYQPLKDFAPIALMASIPSVLVVAPGLPAKSVKEFVALAKAKPGELNYASIGSGTAAHLSAEIFNRAAGIQTVHVPFKTVADSYTEIFASRVHYVVYVTPAAMPMLREGKARALAVTGAARSPMLPDVPTMAEAGLPGAQVDSLFGLVAPAGTPGELVQKLNADIVSVLRRPETKKRFETQTAEPAVDTTPDSYARQIATEYERYRKLFAEIGLKPQ
jgi:tripartite-type tricarboxylate transporter receptor subunit TctC